MASLTFLLLCLFVGVAFSIDVRKSFEDHSVISIKDSDLDEDVSSLMNLLDADKFGVFGNSHDYKIEKRHLEELKTLGVTYEERSDHWISHFEKNFLDPSLFCDDNDEACGGRTFAEFFDSYQSYGAIISRIQGLVADSPLAEMSVLGQSYEGKDIHIVKLGDDDIKPIGFVFCNIHAREWLTPMFCTYLIETLLANGGHPLLDTFTFAIVPSANPDGYEYSRNVDNMWRKTRKPNSGSSCVGTDGNRNWDNNHCGVGSSQNPCSQTYCGEAPFDNVEVELLNRFSLDNLDRLLIMMDIHSYGSYLIHPYGYTETLPPDEDYIRMRQCARLATEAAKGVSGDTWEYGTTPQVLGYNSGGTSKDYLYGNLGVVYAYTVELRGPGFQPPASNIKLSNSEAFALLEEVFECAKDIDVDGNGAAPTPPPTCNGFFC